VQYVGHRYIKYNLIWDLLFLAQSYSEEAVDAEMVKEGKGKRPQKGLVVG
jgi:hypothetical protein